MELDQNEFTFYITPFIIAENLFINQQTNICSLIYNRSIFEEKIAIIALNLKVKTQDLYVRVYSSLYFSILRLLFFNR
jgi:hypothetical protein